MTDKTTTAKKAQAALGPRPQLLDEAGLIDTLKQDCLTQQQLAEQARAQGKSNQARMHFGIAASQADLLSRYYQAHNQIGAATDWAQRALRYQRRSMFGRNTISENIGASMP